MHRGPDASRYNVYGSRGQATYCCLWTQLQIAVASDLEGSRRVGESGIAGATDKERIRRYEEMNRTPRCMGMCCDAASKPIAGILVWSMEFVGFSIVSLECLCLEDGILYSGIVRTLVFEALAVRWPALAPCPKEVAA